MGDIGRGPVAADTCIFIYFIEESSDSDLSSEAQPVKWERRLGA